MKIHDLVTFKYPELKIIKYDAESNSFILESTVNFLVNITIPAYSFPFKVTPEEDWVSPDADISIIRGNQTFKKKLKGITYKAVLPDDFERTGRYTLIPNANPRFWNRTAPIEKSCVKLPVLKDSLVHKTYEGMVIQTSALAYYLSRFYILERSGPKYFEVLPEGYNRRVQALLVDQSGLEFPVLLIHLKNIN